ncbi:hypothetical protein [Aliikangiella maris]|uniref:Uncharacterized protein n=2 Tax=Aliikangiella maris TaxID=3162458 RepID=A0ABV2BQA5_9GAMM
MVTPILILILLVLPLLIAFIGARSKQAPVNVCLYACRGLAMTFFFFAVGHFVKTDGMVVMMPEWVPYRYFWVYVTGVLEVLIGFGLLLKRYQLLASRFAIAIFISFFPVNIYAAWHGFGLGGHQWGLVYLWIRAPLQLILIGWAYFLCIKPLIGRTQ